MDGIISAQTLGMCKASRTKTRLRIESIRNRSGHQASQRDSMVGNVCNICRRHNGRLQPHCNLTGVTKRKGMFDDALIVFSAGAAAQRSSPAPRRLC